MPHNNALQLTSGGLVAGASRPPSSMRRSQLNAVLDRRVKITGITSLALSAALVTSMAACREVPPPRGILSDESLQAYATSRYDKEEFTGRTLELGTHRGSPVVVEFPCSDLCPAYTVRVIRYVVPPGKQCADIGGVPREFTVPKGVAHHLETFCFPAPVVEVWSGYTRASGNASWF